MDEKSAKIKKMRIGIDGRVLQEKKLSGIGQYALNIIKEISKNDDYRFIIFYNSFRSRKSGLPDFGQNTEQKIFRLPNRILEWAWRFFRWPHIDRILKVEAFFSPHFISIPLSSKVKKILTIHDLSFERNKRFFPINRNLWHWQMHPRRASEKYDKIIAVSNNTKKDLIEKYQTSPEKIAVIHEGCHTKNLNIDKTILNKWGIEEKQYILFLATLEPRKNIESIIEAYQMLPDKKYPLVIAGKKGWLFQKIFQKIKEYQLEENIIFTDFVSEEEKKTLFAGSILFVFPSFYEGFGLPIVEAASYGVPIICSAVSSMPEIIKDAAILINPHDIAALSKSMQILLGDGKLREMMGQKSKKIAQNYNWEKAGEKTLRYIVS